MWIIREVDKYFYPRPPRGGRQALPFKGSRRKKFLSTPSARRATTAAFSMTTMSRFLSTPSARRATCGMPYGTQPETISIHALREEGDRMPSTSFSRSSDFYPRPPRGGRPARKGHCVPNRKFLSTPSARRATKAAGQIAKLMQFLSTPSARRATPAAENKHAAAKFLSTPSARRATTSRSQ